jgi:hypothetical protein
MLTLMPLNFVPGVPAGEAALDAAALGEAALDAAALGEATIDAAALGEATIDAAALGEATAGAELAGDDGDGLADELQAVRTRIGMIAAAIRRYRDTA